MEFIYPTFDGSAFPQLNVVRTTPPTVDLGVVEVGVRVSWAGDLVVGNKWDARELFFFFRRLV